MTNNRKNCPIFKTLRVAKMIWRENMLGYLSLDTICSSKLTVFLELLSWKTVGFSEQIMSAEKYPSLFSRQTLAYFRVKLLRKRHKVEDHPQELEGGITFTSSL